MLSAARCETCNAKIPVRARLASFALPPAVVTCPGCQKRIETILLFRATWMEALVWKALALASLPVSLWLAWQHRDAPHGPWTWLAIGLVGGGLAAGFLLSRVLAFPLTLVLDRSRGQKS